MPIVCFVQTVALEERQLCERVYALESMNMLWSNQFKYTTQNLTNESICIRMGTGIIVTDPSSVSYMESIRFTKLIKVNTTVWLHTISASIQWQILIWPWSVEISSLWEAGGTPQTNLWMLCNYKLHCLETLKEGLFFK